MDETTIQQLVQLVQTGDKAQAMRLLATILRYNPQDERAWLAMAQITDGEQRADCLKRVLAISPNNAYAVRMLRASPSPAPMASGEPPGGSLTPPPALATPFQGAGLGQGVPPQPAATPTQSKVAARPPAARARQPARWMFFASVVAGLVVLLGILGIWWIVFHQLQRPAASAYTIVVATAAGFPTFPPTWTPVPAPTEVPTRPRPTATDTAVPTTAGKGATAVAQATAADADRAAALIQSGNNQQALLLLDGIIAQSPRDARAYYLRAKASTNLLYAMDAHQQLQPSAYQCLADINQAILLEPTSGEYRVLRYQIKELLALNARLRVEQDYWYGQAIDDLRQATALHSSLTNSSGLTAIFLASAGHCQEAVDQANRLVAAAGFDVNPYLHFTLSVAYFCRGDMATALKYLDASLPFEKSEQLLWQRTITLYSLGRLEEARTQFDEMVAEYPGCYCRHALRTLIDIKLGERQTALDDLGVALSYGGPTPWAAGLYDYVQGLMALNYQGDRQAAASALQKAELELTFEEGPVILSEIRDLMTQLGVTPLTPTLSVPPTPTPQL